jgi:benzoate-CoA ligase
MFKVKGMWVSPVEVEDALLRHEMVRDCAVIGAPNKHGLTEPVAFVVSHDSAASHRLAEHLSQHCEDLLARYKSPTKYTFIDSIPRTATGKKKRYEFRNRGSSDRGASEA